MIVAIPAVTEYINNSRKSSYVDSAKNIVGGARSLVNEGRLEMYDTSTTYYLPHDMIKTENSSKSPYGNFRDAYIVVTFNGKGYDYYWTSTDTSDTGIYLAGYNLLDNDSIISGVKEISTDIAICGKENIIVFNQDGTIKERKTSSDCINPDETYIPEGDIANCKYKLVTEYGSFDKTWDLKETYADLIPNYTFNTIRTNYATSEYHSNMQHMLFVSAPKEDFQIHLM